MNDAGQKPKIFIFSTAYLPMVGGAELAIKAITDRLKDDFDFILFAARFSRRLPKNERVGAVNVYRLGFGASFDKYLLPIFGYFKARDIIKNYKPQAISCKLMLWGMMASYGSIAAYFLKRQNPNLKFLLTLQEGDPEEYLTSGRLGMMGFWLKRVIRRADKIQTISAFLKRLAVKLGANPSEVEIVPNGADLKVFGQKFPDDELKNLAFRYGIDFKNKAVITVSRLVKKNAIDVLIRAAADVAGCRLFIAGAGPLEDELRDLVRQLKIEKRVHFLGILVHAELARYFAISHVFARPSRSEGLGSAFLEAMAAGLPVIGTPVGGIHDFLRHNETGLFCEADNHRDLAVKIKSFFHNENFRKEIGANAKKIIEDRYSWDKISAQMAMIFYRLLR